MSANRKRIAVSVQLGMSFRNFILTDILSDLKKTGHEITVLTSSRNLKDAIDARFPIRLLKTPGRIMSRLLRWEDQILYIAFYLQHRSETMRKYVERDRNAAPLSWNLKRLLASVIRLCPPLKWLVHRIAARSYATVTQSFDAVLCLSFDVLEDRLLLLAAANTRTPSFVAVHSWDNLPARGFIPGPPKHLIVWNEEMVMQAERLHGFSARDVAVIGVPQFQHMVELARRGINSQEIDPRLRDKNFVVYCASASRVFPDEADFVEQTIQLCQRLGLLFVLRMHPNERVEAYRKKYQNDPRVVLSAASGFFSAGAPKRPMNEDPSLEFKTFTALMSTSLAVINLASTTSLDAMVFGTPVICPRFNVDPSLKGGWNEAARWYESVHFAPVVASDAVELVDSFRDMEQVLKQLMAGATPRKQAAMDFMREFSPKVKPSEVIAKLLQELA